jgi:hypothetical protein
MMDMGNGDGLKRYYGKYRGTVVNNVDPEQRGRILAQVPDVLGLIPSSWAMPCVPIAGKQQGTFFIPQLGAGVWIEFEQGDPDFPVWVGGFWGLVGEVPAMALAPPAIPPGGQNIVVQTTNQNLMAVSDAPPTPLSGGIVLRSTGGARIVVNDSGIYIDNGKGASIQMIGPNVVINNGGLTVI